MAKNLAEAEECVKKAEKYLKTSLMKWKPDYDSAASEYDRAAVCYKNAHNSEKCLEAYLNAADCHEKNGILFHAARSKEQAALVCRDLKRLDDAKKYMEEAARLYSETGTPDTSAMALDKAAKFFEPVDPAKALEIYEKALSIVEDHPDKSRMIAEFSSRISKLYLKLENYEKAATAIGREIATYTSYQEAPKVGKLTAGLVLVHLARGDSVAASKSYQQAYAVKDFGTTEDAVILPPMIDAFEKGDSERFQRFINHPHMKVLDNEFLKLIKKIKLPGGNESGVTKSVNRTGEGISSQNDDDEGDGSLL